jgi:hypothetical protein
MGIASQITDLTTLTSLVILWAAEDLHAIAVYPHFWHRMCSQYYNLSNYMSI